jgi:arabinogalactan oligomer/maltooligosaccharide transport system substrate-binding protein
MFIAPNDSLGQDAREGSLLDLDEYLAGNAQLEGYLPVALDGSKVDGVFYMVPESLKAVALWYDKSKVATPPADSAALLAGVKDGSIKLGINQGVYHQFGWSGAFGGELMDDTGACTADDGGFADAFGYLKELKDAGAVFNTDGNALKTQFQTGEINAIIDGPWQTADFRTALGENLAVAPIPAGPAAAANPFTGTDGWYINPNLDPEQAQLAVNTALALTSPESMQTFVDDAGHVPANPAVTITDPITQGFSDAAAAGLPRPQNEQFNNWWGPFGDALNKVIDTGADPATAVADACALMDEASGL